MPEFIELTLKEHNNRRVFFRTSTIERIEDREGHCSIKVADYYILVSQTYDEVKRLLISSSRI